MSKVKTNWVRLKTGMHKKGRRPFAKVLCRDAWDNEYLQLDRPLNGSFKWHQDCVEWVPREEVLKKEVRKGRKGYIV